MNTAQDYIRRLDLKAHPEGGYYKEIYRSRDMIGTTAHETKHASTAIYYLLKESEFSAFHRIRSDEIWHFYDGSGVLEVIILNKGRLDIKVLGLNLESGQTPCIAVDAGSWFAVRVKDNKGFVLAGCTVAPGFEFSDFEMARKEELLKEYPQHESLIKDYCIL